MHATRLAQSAYAPAIATQTPRDIERRAFERVNARLGAAIESGSFPCLCEAMHENLRLWTTLAVDCASEGNGLPRQLRAQIVYLAEFARQHSGKVRAGEDDPRALLEINNIVMKGLCGGGAALS